MAGTEMRRAPHGQLRAALDAGCSGALDASGDVLVLGVVVVLLPDVLDPLLGAGCVGSTSPPDVLLTAAAKGL